MALVVAWDIPGCHKLANPDKLLNPAVVSVNEPDIVLAINLDPGGREPLAFPFPTQTLAIQITPLESKFAYGCFPNRSRTVYYPHQQL